MTPRKSPREEAPFAWVSRAALRKIREEHGGSAPILAVYLALAELASEGNSPTFKAKVSVIAFRAGVSYSTAFRTLPQIEALGLVKVEKEAKAGPVGKERMPSVFTLISTSKQGGGVMSQRHNPFCHPDRTPSVTVTERELTLPKGRELIERKNKKNPLSLPSPSALEAQGEGAADSQNPNVW